MSNRTKFMTMLLFVVAFGAGVGVGMVMQKPRRSMPPIGELGHGKPPVENGGTNRGGPPGSPPGGGPGWLAAELGLTEAQREAMKKIWDKIERPNWQEDMEKRRAISKQRDEAIKKLIPADKQAEFDAILESSSKQASEVGAKRKESFDAAVKETRALLTPEQQKKYDEMMARKPDGRRGPGGLGGPGGPGGPGRGPGPEREHEHRRPPGGPGAGPTSAPTPAPESL